MSNHWFNAAMENTTAKNGARLMLFVLANRADDMGVSYYGISTLAQKTNLAERAAHYAITELRSLGLLQVQYKKGPSGCNVYTLQNLHGANNAQCKEEQGTLQIMQPDPANSAPKTSGRHQNTSVKIDRSRATLDECRAFAEQQGLPASDGEAFFHGKEGNGWKNGRNPVKNWQATFLNWKASGYHPSQKQGPVASPNGNGQHSKGIDMTKRLTKF